ncbi:hypothetical protein [Acinetobacter pragensis]|uniref:Uncharacterized protein n=1 Tax=Acinetobacter pragensis TaxID=1806892 RepID=A0A151Y5C2_9GAMM|nr:hypothetical protein [Acinetobacter pragensis]KYQ73233.1 hypothetical protein AZH43_07355 [Acinetobacter pragensis]
MAENTDKNLLAITADAGSDQNLIVEEFLGHAKADLDPAVIEQVQNGEQVDGVTAYARGNYYKISANPDSPDYIEPFDIHLHFQDGPTALEGVNGATNEALLKVLIHRTQILDSQFPSEHNKQAIAAMETALAAFDARTTERLTRGVEGQKAE